MTSLNEDNVSHFGYSIMELPSAANSRSGLDHTQLSLDDLEQQARALDDEIRTAQDDLTLLQDRASSAVQTENANEVTAAWTEKQRLAGRLAELLDSRKEVQRLFDGEVAAIWDALQREREETHRLGMDHDSGLRELIAAAEALLDTAMRVAAVRSELSAHQQFWEAHLDRLQGRVLPPLPASRAAARTPHERQDRPAPHNPKLERPAHRQWSVYDPDAGRLVDNAGDLLKLLVRWYPALHTDEERVQEFLAMPNAEPLPERLRNELRDKGLM